MKAAVYDRYGPPDVLPIEDVPKQASHGARRGPRQDPCDARQESSWGSTSARPVIDRAYPLEDVVEAHRYVETHQKVGNVVLAVA